MNHTGRCEKKYFENISRVLENVGRHFEKTLKRLGRGNKETKKIRIILGYFEKMCERISKEFRRMLLGLWRNFGETKKISEGIWVNFGQK